MADSCYECGEPTFGGRAHCAVCSACFGPYDDILGFTTPAQADEFVRREVAKLTKFPWCMVALHPDEAERITRKNAVRHAHAISSERGKQAEKLFNCEDPLR